MNESSAALGRLHHVGVVVDDLEAATRFFQETGGLAVTRRITLPGGAGEAVFLGAGAAEIELMELHDAEARARRLGDARGRLDHVAFDVPDLDGAVSRLRAAGVTTQTPEPITPAGRPMIFTDGPSSEGVVLQLIG